MPYSGTPDEIKAKRQAHYAKNREKHLKRFRDNRAANPGPHRARAKARREGPLRESILEAKRAAHREAQAKDPNYRAAYFNDPAIKARKSEYDRQRRAREGEKLKAQQKAWLDRNRDHTNAYCREKRRTSPQYAISNNLRCRINTALRAQGLKRDKRLEVLLGCTVADLMTHLEKQFTSGMTWANRGHKGHVWHVDHRKPCNAFDLTDPAQQAACFHFTNLQPLWAVENIRKSDSYEPAA